MLGKSETSKRKTRNGAWKQEDRSSKREGHKMEIENEDRKDRRDRSGREDKMEMTGEARVNGKHCPR